MEKGIVQDLVNQSGSIVPIVEGKRSIKNWNQYQTQAATKEEVGTIWKLFGIWFDDGTRRLSCERH
jgi:Holliday junction resolvase-like predicted endonuclease